jgi:hypothetical protein
VDAIDIAAWNGGGATKPDPEKCREDETLLARSSPSPELQQKNARSTDAFAVSLREAGS